MIRKTFLIGLLAIGLQLTSGAAFELSTSEHETSLEGIKLKQLVFKDKGRTVWYQPPRNWTISGGAAKIRMTPRELTFAQGEVEQSPLPAPQKFDEELMKTLQEATLASVPPTSQKVTLVSAETNPLMVNGHQTYAVTVSYQAHGQDFVASVLYLNLPDTQIRFRTTARKQDFEKVHAAVRRSIFSWQWK